MVSATLSNPGCQKPTMREGPLPRPGGLKEVVSEWGHEKQEAKLNQAVRREKGSREQHVQRPRG